MVRRNEPELKGAHLKWEFPGGKVDFGETIEEAIVREIEEETGVIVKIKRLLPCTVTTNWEYPWGIQQTLIFGFECAFKSERKRKEDHHVNEVEWVPVGEVLSRESLPGGKEFLEALNS
jgi:8-oxo-dGTP diphosphatase